MTLWRLALALCTFLSGGVPAVSAELNPQQIQIARDTATSICDTVKEAKGQKTNVQIQGDVNAKLNGFLGKIADLGVSTKGSLTREEFDGLSQDATATALEGDRGCRERVFNKMFDKLSAAQQNVTAPGGVAAGGNINNSPITIGIPPAMLPGLIEAAEKDLRDLSEQRRQEIDTLRQNLRVTQTQLVYIARGLGVDNVPIAELGPALMDRVGRLHLAEKETQALPDDNPVKPLLEAANRSGAYDRAERLFAVSQRTIQAVGFINEGHPDQAIACLKEAEEQLGKISMDSSIEARLIQGYIYKTYEEAFSAKADKAQAEQYLGKALAIFKSLARETIPEGKGAAQFASAINGMGNLRAAQGDYRGAIGDYQVATSLLPNYAYAWHDMFLGYFHLAEQGDVHLEAMRQALDKTKETGQGWPGLEPGHIAQLEDMLARVEQINKQDTRQNHP
jgi:tetratricopeptide (TPR) repeat protein